MVPLPNPYLVSAHIYVKDSVVAAAIRQLLADFRFFICNSDNDYVCLGLFNNDFYKKLKQFSSLKS